MPVPVKTIENTWKSPEIRIFAAFHLELLTALNCVAILIADFCPLCCQLQTIDDHPNRELWHLISPAFCHRTNSKRLSGESKCIRETVCVRWHSSSSEERPGREPRRPRLASFTSELPNQRWRLAIVRVGLQHSSHARLRVLLEISAFSSFHVFTANRL